MKFYQTTTEYSCGIDLHTRQMYMCVMDQRGKKLIHTNIRGNDFAYFLEQVKPYRGDLTVVCECTFNWPWLADACADAEIEFVLGHALYLRAIHGGKNKNDRIDSEKLAHLLRSNLIPPAYVYPRERRPVRNLLRRRTSFVWKRAALLSHLSSQVHVVNEEPIGQCQHRVRERWYEKMRPLFDDALMKTAVEADMYMVKEFDKVIDRLERAVHKYTKANRCRDYNLLKTIPGIGPILALTILYETDDINRFASVGNYSSYCRLVKGSVASAGKVTGTRGGKMGNAYLRWAFGHAAVICKRDNPQIKAYAKRLENSHPKQVANAILANKLARSVYFMLKRGKGFDPEVFAKKCA